MPSLFAVLLFFFGLLGLASAEGCNQTCGSYTAPYPFGFSDGCSIRLNCSDSAASPFLIGEFAGRNLTQDAIWVDVPRSCSRPVSAARSLIGPNFALTNRTALLLRNCTRWDSGGSCRAESVLIDDSCGRYENTTCFLNATHDIMKDVNASSCGVFFVSGVTYGSPVMSVEFNTAELAWWLPGPCLCSSDASSESVRVQGPSSSACRCRCREGFQGDGFVEGKGCQRVSNSNPKCNPTKFVTGDCGGSTSKYRTLIGGIAGASTTAALVLVCCWLRRRTSLTRKRESMRRFFSEASRTVPLYSYKDIEKATDGFSPDRILGTGAYGTVYSGYLGSTGRQVAVKRIKNRDGDTVEQVMNEIKLLSSVSHPNLVILLGCCVEQSHEGLILVYEYMACGTLAQHLQRERGSHLPWTVRLDIAVDTAKAIAYLHSAVRPPIFHRDIKSSNILLDSAFHSKVADFGLSRMGLADSTTFHSHISTAPQGTPGYVDPQYHQNCHLSDKSDVYSFGVVLMEIITGMKAVDLGRPQNEVNLAALAVDRIRRGRVDEILDPFLEPHRDAWTLASVHKVAELAFRCLAFHRDMRPSMTEVVDELEQIKLSGWAPTEDLTFLSTASSFCSSPASSMAERTSQASCKTRRLVLVKSTVDEVNVESPMSVQDPWLSEQGSPSAHSLLGNVIR
ncbi:wall-associated receptor kinase-like 14 [Zingiber officinale]|uniref:wall-associated receptor kinase-like 14 n=1 Tax=Zingiber officinale TaxID=94328 RepID=UPI001C4D6EEC|nr:wall-associated receptor kinase-like 14 [Zingiber officinale]